MVPCLAWYLGVCICHPVKWANSENIKGAQSIDNLSLFVKNMKDLVNLNVIYNGYPLNNKCVFCFVYMAINVLVAAKKSTVPAN